jgi:excisionase family DNA binding protein
MGKTLETEEAWLTIGQAADRLGVHTTTLRRWSDEGEISFILTPGGHRRYAVSEIDRFTEEHRRQRLVSDLGELWAEKALTRARSEIVSHREKPWLAIFDEEDRERKRLLGQRLMGLLLQYVSVGEGGEEIVDEAHMIGREHAENALEMGIPSRDALRAAMFFRDAIIETAINLPATAKVRPESNARLVRRINQLLNTVQLAIAETYDQAAGDHVA